MDREAGNSIRIWANDLKQGSGEQYNKPTEKQNKRTPNNRKTSTEEILFQSCISAEPDQLKELKLR